MEAEVSRATLVTGPTAEPITIAEARKQVELSPTDTAHDDHLTALIQAAREKFEHDTDLALLTQTWSVTLEELNDDEIYLPKRPVQSITHIKYYDSLNTQQTMSTSVYSLDAAARAVRLNYLQVWPFVLNRWDAVTITYVCGYSSVAAVPQIYKQAMKLLIAHNFENRDMLLPEAMQTVPAYEMIVRAFGRATYP